MSHGSGVTGIRPEGVQTGTLGRQGIRAERSAPGALDTLNRGQTRIHSARRDSGLDHHSAPPGRHTRGDRRMSYKATAWAYELPIKGPAKVVLVALADFADEAGSCYPGQERLCQMTGLSIRTLRRALERVERMDLLRRERRFDSFGHRTSDRYYLQLDVQSLPVTVTSGHSDLGSESPSLPVRESIPTGHSDRVTISRTTSDPSGGGEDAPTPTPVLVPWCKRHAATEGHDGGCAACKKARLAWEQSLATASQEQQWVPVAPKRSKHWKPGLCEGHLQPEATCDACAQDRKRGIA